MNSGHGWTFDPHGDCTEMPAGNEVFRSKVKIRVYPSREYLGLIFAYLGDGAAPEFPLYPEIDPEKDTVIYQRNPIRCNYFQRIENDLDETHIHFVHKVSTDEIGLV